MSTPQLHSSTIGGGVRRASLERMMMAANSYSTRTLPLVESWNVEKVVVWAAGLSLSSDNRPDVIGFLRGGITGKVLLSLNESKLILLCAAKIITYGAAIELAGALGDLKAELGTVLSRLESLDGLQQQQQQQRISIYCWATAGVRPS